MSDIHHLPLQGRDLPEVIEVPREEWLKRQKRARVYYDGYYWRWSHDCAWHTGTADGYPYTTLSSAHSAASEHVKRCSS